MQHILNIAFEFDDEKVKQTAENAVDNEMDKIVKEIVTDKIAPMTAGWYGKPERDWTPLWNRVDAAIAKILEDNRDKIIDRAADKLVKSARSSKAWKNKFAEVIENE